MGLDSFCNYYLCGLVLEFVTYTNLDDTVFEFYRKNKVNTLPRISRICTKLGLDKTLCFVLFHEFSPDGDVVMRGECLRETGRISEGDCYRKSCLRF